MDKNIDKHESILVIDRRGLESEICENVNRHEINRYVSYLIIDKVIAILGMLILFVAFLHITAFVNTPLPSQFCLNSHIAEIGIIPGEQPIDYYLYGKVAEKVYLPEAPFIKNGKMYLPVQYVAFANGIKNIITSGDRVIIIDNNQKITIDCRYKEVICNRSKINVQNSLIILNKNVFLSLDVIKKLFAVETKINKNKITIIVPKSKIFVQSFT